MLPSPQNVNITPEKLSAAQQCPRAPPFLSLANILITICSKTFPCPKTRRLSVPLSDGCCRFLRDFCRPGLKHHKGVGFTSNFIVELKWKHSLSPEILSQRDGMHTGGRHHNYQHQKQTILTWRNTSYLTQVNTPFPGCPVALLGKACVYPVTLNAL